MLVRYGMPVLLFGMLSLLISGIWLLLPWLYGPTTAIIPRDVAIVSMIVSGALVIVGASVVYRASV